MTQEIAVLLYHDVSEREPPRAWRRWAISRDRLAEHMSALGDAGYSSLTIGALASTIGDTPQRRVAITFDDAFTTFTSVALPVLRSAGMASTVFVPTAYVGGPARWLRHGGAHAPAVLAWTELAALDGEEVEVGSHGDRHLQLDVASRRAVRDDLVRSKALLEDHVGVPVTSFAYPFGYHDAAVRASVAAAGYRCACEVGYGLHRLGTDAMRIRRIHVDADMTAEGLLAVMASGRPSAVQLLRRHTRLAWRITRRTGHAVKRAGRRV